MGTYKYEIFTSGYSNEIVVGTMDDEIVNKVEELCDEHDMTIPELYEDFELLGDNEIPEWHENDNKEHIYGPSIDGGTLNVVNVETNEVVLEKDFFDLDAFELDEHIVETKLHLYEGKPLFHCATIEKGVAMHGFITYLFFNNTTNKIFIICRHYFSFDWFIVVIQFTYCFIFV